MEKATKKPSTKKPTHSCGCDLTRYTGMTSIILSCTITMMILTTVVMVNVIIPITTNPMMVLATSKCTSTVTAIKMTSMAVILDKMMTIVTNREDQASYHA